MLQTVPGQLRFFALLLMCTGVFCGLPLIGLGVFKNATMLTTCVGLLFVLFGYVGLRLWMIARTLERDERLPASTPPDP